MTSNPETFNFITARNDADIENMITTIYHKTRIRVSRDDPLLAMYYVNCFMAGRLEETMRQVMEDYSRRMFDVTKQTSTDATGKAESIVNGAIKASESIVHAAITDSASAIRAESVKAMRDIKAAHEGIEKTIGGLVDNGKLSNASIQKTAGMALIASAVAAVAGLAALAVSLLR